MNCKRILLALPLSLCLSQTLNAALPAFTTQAFELANDTKQIVVADLNNDSRYDLIAVMEDRLRVYFQEASGFNFEEGFDDIVFTDQAVGWDISTNYNTDGRTQIIALVEGKTLYSWQADGTQFSEPETIQTGFSGFLGKGLNRLYFSRDINRDSMEDLIIPGAGSLNIHIKVAPSEYQPPLSINSDFRIRTNLDSSRLDRRIGQAIRIPTLELRDVNGDQLDDLISKTEEKLDVFLAQAAGSAYFLPTPSFTLDIAEIEERLGEFDIDNLDFSNLTGILALTHEEVLEDINGDGIDDLLLREGGKVSVFSGHENGIEMETPKQVLRSGGNVLSTFMYDENEDNLKDLWLWRVEPISVGDIFVWLALSGSIAVEAFIYPNQGESFTRRPSRKITIALKFPSVIRLTNTFRDLEDEVSAAAESNEAISIAANLDGEPGAQDLVRLVNNQLSVFINAIESEPKSTEFLGAIGYTRSKNDYEIDLSEILEKATQNSLSDIRDDQSQQSQALLTLPATGEVSDIIPALINDDEIDDLIIFENPGSGLIKGLLLLSQDALK